MQKRVVIVEGLWPNHAFEEGIGINLLTSADPGLPGGGAVFHDTSVWLRPGVEAAGNAGGQGGSRNPPLMFRCESAGPGFRRDATGYRLYANRLISCE